MKTNTSLNAFRPALASFAALAMALVLAAPPVAAQTVGDLSCSGCVDKEDLARGAISTPKLKKGAVKWNKLGNDVRQRFDDLEAHFEYVSVAGAIVRPDRPGSVAQLSALGSVSSAQVDDTFLIGAVQLPHLMTVDSMTCVVADRDDTAYIQVLLLRSPVTDFEGTPDSDLVASSGTGRPAVGEDPVPLDMRVRDEFSVIDNRLYHYYMRVDMLDVPQPPTARLMFHGCTIKLAKNPT
jgi:hypothetical protein